MAGLNKCQFIGNLGADPEVRSMNNGGEVVNLRLAVSETWKDKDGNRQERTEWVPVVIFNENIGRVAKSYCRKGSKVFVEGAMQTRKWTDKDGADRYSTEVVVQRFRGELVLLDAKRDDYTPDRQNNLNDPEPTTSDRGVFAGTDLDDDVPF